MDNVPAIEVKHVGKNFHLPHEKHAGLKQAILNFRPGKKYETQRALKDISFEINKGEFFGIVGRNGSGKSTMLKILAGIYQPTTGSVDVRGRLVPFIELGVGFNPELTGRDNVFLNGALLGFNRKQMEAMYDKIVDFAELAEFMDQKLKNYSSGMQVRLAFSIAIRAEAEILLIDEVLAVGDDNFQRKCVEIFEELKRDGQTIIFVSHSMAYVREFCDRVAVIDGGDLLFVGDTEKAVDIYNKLNSEREVVRTEAENAEKKVGFERFGNGQAEITSYKFFDKHGKETIKLVSGEPFRAEVRATFSEDVKNTAVGVMFRKNPLENLYGLNSYYSDKRIDAMKAGSSLVVNFKDTMPLNPGSYYVSFAVAGMRGISHEDFDNLNNIMKITVTGPDKFWGILSSEPEITIGEKA